MSSQERCWTEGTVCIQSLHYWVVFPCSWHRERSEAAMPACAGCPSPVAGGGCWASLWARLVGCCREQRQRSLRYGLKTGFNSFKQCSPHIPGIPPIMWDQLPRLCQGIVCAQLEHLRGAQLGLEFLFSWQEVTCLSSCWLLDCGILPIACEGIFLTQYGRISALISRKCLKPVPEVSVVPAILCNPGRIINANNYLHFSSPLLRESLGGSLAFR